MSDEEQESSSEETEKDPVEVPADDGPAKEDSSSDGGDAADEAGDDDALFSLDDLDDLLGDEEDEAEKEDLASLDEPVAEEETEEEPEEDSGKPSLKERLTVVFVILEKVKRPFVKFFKPIQILLRPFAKVFSYLNHKFGQLFGLVTSKSITAFKSLKTNFPIFLKSAKAKFTTFRDGIKGRIAAFKALNKKRKMAVVALVGMGVVFIYLLKVTVTGGRWIPLLSKPILKSIETVADKVEMYDPKSEAEYLHSAFRQPYFTFLLEGFRVNLKPSLTSSRLPMAYVEIYLTLDATETAIEVKDRQYEIRDYVARILEDSTYDELKSGYGKKRIKLKIKTKINEVLNHGMVREVLINNLVHKR